MAEYLEDLKNENSQSYENGNYFIFSFDNLDVGKTYPIQFRWKYKDGTFGENWSAEYPLIITGETTPGAPSITANGNTPGHIAITWNGKTVGNVDLVGKIKQIDIYISGSPFDGTKPTISFDKAATKLVSAPAGLYTIVAYAVTARGTLSTQTTISSIEVQDIAQVVEPATLPSGLSVAPGPFVVSVNWNGTYASSGFEGFKSIDIHVRGSDLGATATSGFSTTTQVATLTVDATTNRQNIGLDNLRQALGLANNTAAYTTPMFFYYIARNQNDELYEVSGTPTYTRINSSSVNPTQANLVDLVNGIISIENLVAGNGRFTSWLRAGGTYTGTIPNLVFNGGTRLEISAVNDFPDPTNSSYTIQKGLTAYNSGNTKIFDLDLDAGTLTIEGSGKFTGDLEAGSGDSIFKSDSNGIYLGSSTWAGAASKFRVSRSGEISAASGTIGGLSLATNSISNSANTFKIGNTGQLLLGSESVGQPNMLFTPTQIVHRTGSSASGIFTLDISTGTLSLSGYATSGQLANKSKTYYQANQPASGMIQGDIWIDSDDNYKVYTYTGSAWQISQDSASAQTTANTAANRAQKFDLVGNVNLGIQLNNTGSIYANKSTYGSGTTGWFLGFRDLGGGTLTPAFDIGGTTSYMRWTGTSLEVQGAITGSTIEGSTITTNGSTSDGTIRISNSNNAIEFLYSGAAVSSIYPFNLGSEIIIQQGVPGSIRYPQSRAYISISSGTATIGYANSSGSRSVGFSIDSTSISAFVGSSGLVTSGGPIYTGTNTTTASDQSEGISLTQGGTLSARRSNANPLNLHRFNVTAATTTSVSVIDFYRNGTARGTLEIFGNTSAPVLVGSSDYRLKENIREYTGGLNKILKTQVKVFNEIEDEEKNDIVGFIAHEFAEVFPEYVIGEKDAVDEDGNPIYQKLSYTNLVPYLISAIKELSQRLDALQG